LKTAADSVVDMIRIDRAQPTAIVQALLKTTPFYTRS
jgi:hypothetical protein